MGFFDTLFGEGPEVNTQTLDTLTPGQRRALESLLLNLSGADPRQFEGDVSVDPSILQSSSLAGLEERAIALSDPNRNAELFGQASNVLMSLMDFESADAGIDDFFRTNVQQPMLEAFQEDILPSIGRSFGGSNFFGSERARADDTAREELIEGLTRSRESLAFNARESDRNRALQALGLVPELADAERGDSRELQNLFGIGERQTALGERNVEREFGQFLAEAGLDDERIRQLLAGINTQAIENVVSVTPGHAGVVGNMLGALSGSTFNFGTSSPTSTKPKPPATGMSNPRSTIIGPPR